MASLNHSVFTTKVTRLDEVCCGYFLLVFELRPCYIRSTVDISIIFGWVRAGIIIGIGLLVTGIQMVFASQRKICKNSWPLIFNILYLVQYLLMNKNENKHEPSKQPSENYYSGETIVRLHTEVIYCK